MRIKEFLKWKKSYLISCCIAGGIIYLILCILGLKAYGVFLSIIYAMGMVIPLLIEFTQKKTFYKKVEFSLENLEDKKLIGELIPEPEFWEGEILYDVIKICNKSMIEEVNKYKFQGEEYREYIEMWVHEVKTPIASASLTLANMEGSSRKSIGEDIDKVEEYIDQVLYYSRSSNVEKDYFIKKVPLKKMCFGVIKSNAKKFIQSNVRIESHDLDKLVFTDEKWMGFILNQVFQNSIKYMNKKEKVIEIWAEEEKNAVTLCIKDNGTGIRLGETNRIFDKGFTGTNGRKIEKSTGMGLYICSRLCSKLGVGISVESQEDEYTRIIISFPKNSLIEM